MQCLVHIITCYYKNLLYIKNGIKNNSNNTNIIIVIIQIKFNYTEYKSWKQTGRKNK